MMNIIKVLLVNVMFIYIGGVLINMLFDYRAFYKEFYYKKRVVIESGARKHKRYLFVPV